MPTPSRNRILVIALGTTGDILPFVALGRRLLAEGYDLTIATSTDFGDRVRSSGVKFIDLGIDIRQTMTQQLGLHVGICRHDSLVTAAWSGVATLRAAAKRCLEPAQSADLLICHRNTTFSYDLASKLQVPTIMAAFQPLRRTREFPYCAFNWPACPAFGTGWAQADTRRGSMMSPLIAARNQSTYALEWIQQLYFDIGRLPPLVTAGKRVAPANPPRVRRNNPRLPTLYAYSPSVVARPLDWPPDIVVTGAWPSSVGSDVLNTTVRDFLATGPPPIYLGFGSMPVDAVAVGHLVSSAVSRWGGRVIVGGGWADVKLQTQSDRILVVPEVSHQALFPRLKAVIHHGGAGTVHTALQHGLPSLAIPHFYDQAFWGRRIQALGAGPAPITLRELTADTLAKALDSLDTSESYRANAAAIGRRISKEDGLEKATTLIRTILD